MSNQPLLFWLGSFTPLSLAELTSLLPAVQWQNVTDQILSTADSLEFGIDQLMNRLGGTIKILRQIQLLDTTTTSDLENQVVDYLSQKSDSRVEFAICSLNRNHLPAVDNKVIKDKLIDRAVKSRFVEVGESGLSSAVWSHHKVTEIICIHLPSSNQTLLAETIACQNVDDWTLRDRGKPYASGQRGLLPPKLARMMVNLAVGNQPNPNSVLVDPFCGSGTVLMEGLTIGVGHVIGGDSDPQAVLDCKRNLDWFAQAVPHTNPIGTFEVKPADATHLELARSVNYLVTEPFMGKARFLPRQVPAIVKGLQKLYLGAFKNWTRFLLPGAKIVFIFPRFMTDGGQSLDAATGLLDKLAELGYTATSGKLDYSRPQADLVRQIYQFVYQPKK